MKVSKNNICKRKFSEIVNKTKKLVKSIVNQCKDVHKSLPLVYNIWFSDVNSNSSRSQLCPVFLWTLLEADKSIFIVSLSLSSFTKTFRMRKCVFQCLFYIYNSQSKENKIKKKLLRYFGCVIHNPW